MNLRALSDEDFCNTWRSLEDVERAAFPDEDRAEFYARYNRLTPWVGQSIDRLRREQSRAPRPASADSEIVPLDDAAPVIRGATEYLEAVEALWKDGLPSGERTGWAMLDRHYTVAPGQLTIITGWPGSGKSEFLDHLLINLAKKDWKFALFSAENQPVQLHIAKLLEKLACRPFGVGPNERIPVEELRELTDELGRSFYFISPVEDAGVSLRKVVAAAAPWLLNGDGRKAGLIVDPWNELEHSRPRHMSETEYISESLSYLRNWARANGVHVWVIAHPAKQQRDDGQLPIPKPDMISGSQHWWNKADCALTVYREPPGNDDAAPPNETTIHIQKIRFKQIGSIGMVKMRYDRVTGRFTEAPLNAQKHGIDQ